MHVRAISNFFCSHYSSFSDQRHAVTLLRACAASPLSHTAIGKLQFP